MQTNFSASAGCATLSSLEHRKLRTFVAVNEDSQQVAFERQTE